MSYAKRDGLSLYYQQEGSGDPPFVFVHGWCCDHTFFQPQFDHFKSSHAVTTLDLRGCGSSDRPDDGYDIPTLADDVAWLCGELGISKPIIVGHSLGGMIGIELAARYPSLPAAIVAVDPGPIDPLPQTRSVFEGFVAQLEGPDGDAVRRAYVAKSDHAEILSCLTDDVEWVIPGAFHLTGKVAFDKEIENDAFVGSPAIRVTRMTEKHDVVVSEGNVRCARRAGGFLNAVFCDVFEMQEAKIRHLTLYLMEIGEYEAPNPSFQRTAFGGR